jgi:hypothetical protein
VFGSVGRGSKRDAGEDRAALTRQVAARTDVALASETHAGVALDELSPGVYIAAAMDVHE